MAAYTVAVPYVASNRFLNFVPWDRLIRGRVLLGHCLALLIVYVITTEALAIKPRLASWFIEEHRKGSFFDLCLVLILFVLAFYECQWAMRENGGEHE
jgi:hypothetical protein